MLYSPLCFLTPNYGLTFLSFLYDNFNPFSSLRRINPSVSFLVKVKVWMLWTQLLSGSAVTFRVCSQGGSGKAWNFLSSIEWPPLGQTNTPLLDSSWLSIDFPTSQDAPMSSCSSDCFHSIMDSLFIISWPEKMLKVSFSFLQLTNWASFWTLLLS